MARTPAPTPERGAHAPAPDSRGAAERVLEEVYALYTKPTAKALAQRPGLEEVAREVGNVSPPVLHPRRRITVMIIGNHSAGKSSFVNYYAGDEVLPTGVAVETQGFTIVRSGRESQDVKSEGALVDNDHIALVASRLGADRRGFIEHLSLLVRPTSAHDMPRIDLIDTPGLVDGNVLYPYDVNRVIGEMASVCDLILVFLDPIGQALCSRTMNVVKDLNDRGYHDRMRYYLTKADTVTRGEDLTKVIVQVTQNLSLRVANTHGFDVPCLWLPDRDDSRESGAQASSARTGAVNSLGRLCAEISKTIKQKVQANMTQCQADCARLLAHIETEAVAEAAKRAKKRSWRCYAWTLAPLFPLLAVLSFLDLLLAAEPRLPPSILAAPAVAAGLAGARPVMAGFVDVADALGVAGLQQRLLAVAGVFLVVSALSQFFKCRTRALRTRAAPALDRLRDCGEAVELIAAHCKALYRDFVRAAQTPDFPLVS